MCLIGFMPAFIYSFVQKIKQSLREGQDYLFHTSTPFLKFLTGNTYWIFREQIHKTGIGDKPPPPHPLSKIIIMFSESFILKCSNSKSIEPINAKIEWIIFYTSLMEREAK